MSAIFEECWNPKQSINWCWWERNALLPRPSPLNNFGLIASFLAHSHSYDTGHGCQASVDTLTPRNFRIISSKRYSLRLNRWIMLACDDSWTRYRLFMFIRVQCSVQCSSVSLRRRRRRHRIWFFDDFHISIRPTYELSYYSRHNKSSVVCGSILFLEFNFIFLRALARADDIFCFTPFGNKKWNVWQIIAKHYDWWRFEMFVMFFRAPTNDKRRT